MVYIGVLKLLRLKFAVVFYKELHDIGKFYAGPATQFLLEQS